MTNNNILKESMIQPIVTNIDFDAIVEIGIV